MSQPYRYALLLSLPLLGVSSAALADDAAVLRCRALADGPARLACYDAMPVGTAAVPAAPAVVAAAPAAASAPARTPEQSFGMEQVKPAPAAVAAAPKSIESTIPGTFTGWGPNTLFKLANGQVWRVVDGSAADLPPVTNQKVRIVRNLFGTMFLEIDGNNNSPKVRRVQ